MLHFSKVLHVIDEILDPSITISLKATAFDFLNQYDRWELNQKTIEMFQKKVYQYGKQDLYKKHGGHTFLIPIDKNIDNHNNNNNIDNDIIDGHIIPNQVLFLRPVEKEFVFETQANGEHIYIVVAFIKNDDKHFIKCYTIYGGGGGVGDNSNKTKQNEMLVEIVHGNIPVTNGVIHLIQQPLALNVHELKPFPYLSVLYKISSDPELNLTYHIGEQCGINQLLNNDNAIFTYFISIDKGWGKYFHYSMDNFYDVFSRHLIRSTQRYTINDLINLSMATVNGTILDTINGPIQLKFEQINNNYFVIWNQKKIRILRPNYQCNNGIVHILEAPFCHIEEIIFDYFTMNHTRFITAATTSKPNFWTLLKHLTTTTT